MGKCVEVEPERGAAFTVSGEVEPAAPEDAGIHEKRGDYEKPKFKARKYFPRADLYEIIAPALRRPGRNPRPYPRRP